jgi:antitoxin CptB
MFGGGCAGEGFSKPEPAAPPTVLKSLPPLACLSGFPQGGFDDRETDTRMMSANDDAVPVPGRLHWQCRRGMRELDLLLHDFLERGYAGLDEAERRAFAVLLDCPDALLFEYLMGHAVPSERTLADVVRKIRDAAAP